MAYTCGMYGGYSGFDVVFFGGLVLLTIIVGVALFIVLNMHSNQKDRRN